MGCGASAEAGQEVGKELLRPTADIRRGSFVSPEIEPSNVPRRDKRTSLQSDQQPTLPGVAQHKIGSFSAHGQKPGANGTAFAKINQDRGLVTYPFNDDPNSAFFAVFDGHGMNGEQVSEYAIWKVQEIMMLNCSMLPHKAEQCMIHAFEEGDKQLARSPVAARVSGTAAVAVFVHGTTLVRAPRTPRTAPRSLDSPSLYFFYPRAQWVANCGDSRAVLATAIMNPDGSKALNAMGIPRFEVTPLTVDQKPDSPAEEARLRRMGGYVTIGNPQVGPSRVWLRKGEGPGLAMSRSIGDHVCKHIGVIATPEVLKFELDPKRESRLVVASDGVWEFLENDQAMEIVMKHDSAADACVALIDESARLWREAEGNYRDDITAIVTTFHSSRWQRRVWRSVAMTVPPHAVVVGMGVEEVVVRGAAFVEDQAGGRGRGGHQRRR